MLTQCTRCHTTVAAKVEGSYETRAEEGVPLRFTLARCPGCHGPILLSQIDWGGGWEEPGRLFPRDDVVGSTVPNGIRNAFSEAVDCLHTGAFTASAIMCRKTLEGVCQDHGLKTGSLAARLKELRNREVIEGRLFDWVNELRLVGNEAAHDVSIEVAAQDASDTIDFTRAVLEYVYTFRERFETFQKRRAERDV